MHQAMIMTAGLGTRLKPFTDHLPKPLFPILGIPVLQFTLDRLRMAGVRRIVMNVHHLPEVFSKALAGLDLTGIDLVLSDEREKLLGSGGGLRKAAHFFSDGPVLYVNGDVLFDFNLEKLLADHRTDVTWWVRPTGPYGETYREVLHDDQGNVTALGTRKSGSSYFAGVAVIEKKCFLSLPENQNLDLTQVVFEPAIERGALRAVLSQGRWHDLGSPELWCRTNRELIEELETGSLPQPWRRRVEAKNHRIADRVWVDHASAKKAKQIQIAGPAYLNAPHFTGDQLGPDEYIFDSMAGLGPGSVSLGETRYRISPTT